MTSVDNKVEVKVVLRRAKVISAPNTQGDSFELSMYGNGDTAPVLLSIRAPLAMFSASSERTAPDPTEG